IAGACYAAIDCLINGLPVYVIACDHIGVSEITCGADYNDSACDGALNSLTKRISLITLKDWRAQTYVHRAYVVNCFDRDSVINSKYDVADAASAVAFYDLDGDDVRVRGNAGVIAVVARIPLHVVRV